jgi:hypothetical protein
MDDVHNKQRVRMARIHRRSPALAACIAILALGASSAALACSCLAVPVGEVYAQSDFVYVARVVAVRRITANPVRNSPAEYEVTFEAIRRIKGGDPGRRTARFRHTFEGLTAADLRARSEGGYVGEEELVMSSCDMRYELDELYLVLLEKNAPLGTIGLCSSRVRPYSWEALQEVEALREP